MQTGQHLACGTIGWKNSHLSLSNSSERAQITTYTILGFIWKYLVSKTCKHRYVSPPTHTQYDRSRELHCPGLCWAGIRTDMWVMPYASSLTVTCIKETSCSTHHNILTRFSVQRSGQAGLDGTISAQRRRNHMNHCVKKIDDVVLDMSLDFTLSQTPPWPFHHVTTKEVVLSFKCRSGLLWMVESSRPEEQTQP